MDINNRGKLLVSLQLSFSLHERQHSFGLCCLIVGSVPDIMLSSNDISKNSAQAITCQSHLVMLGACVDFLSSDCKLASEQHFANVIDTFSHKLECSSQLYTLTVCVVQHRHFLMYLSQLQLILCLCLCVSVSVSVYVCVHLSVL